MESNLEFIKEGDKVILMDKNVYESVDDLQQLYNTFKAMKLNAENQKAMTENNLVRINQELEVTNNRFEQLKQFLEKEGVEFDDTEVELKE